MAKILVVDGDKKSAKAVAKALTDAGHACAVRHRGQEALDIIDNEALDLLLIDTMLPDVSGFSVCRNIRRSSELFHLPIVFFSTMNNKEEIEHGLAQGADDFISKPIDFSMLVQHVNRLVSAAEHATYTDTVTGLPDAEETRRRVQLRITRGHPFALIYVELMGLRRLTESVGAQGRDKALRHLGRALKMSLESESGENAFVGHMGGGFFLCILPAEHAEKFAAKLLRSWRKHKPSLASNLDLRESVTADPSDFLDLMICTTAREARDPCSVQDLLETLTRIRRSVHEEIGGVHVDRRLSAPAQEAPSGGSGV